MEGGYANGKTVSNLPSRVNSPTAEMSAKRRPVSRVPVGASTSSEKENQFRGPVRRMVAPHGSSKPFHFPTELDFSSMSANRSTSPHSGSGITDNMLASPPRLSPGSPHSMSSLSPVTSGDHQSTEMQRQQIKTQIFGGAESRMPPRSSSYVASSSPPPQPVLAPPNGPTLPLSLSSDSPVGSPNFSPQPHSTSSSNAHLPPLHAPSLVSMSGGNIPQLSPSASPSAPVPGPISGHTGGQIHRRNSSSHSVKSTGPSLRHVPSHSTIRYQAEFYSSKQDRNLGHKATTASSKSQGSTSTSGSQAHPTPIKRYNTSSYVRELRRKSATVFSEITARQWGLPIGISNIAPLGGNVRSGLSSSKSGKGSSAASYKRTMDIRHTHLQPRLLASEFDDDDDDGITDLQSPVSSAAAPGVWNSGGNGSNSHASSTPKTHTSNNSAASVVLTDHSHDQTSELDASPKPSRRSRASSSSSSLEIDEGISKLKLFVANPDSD